MTANKRIFLNIVATYGRSLIALVCGLLSGRWVLESLGVEAYGVYAVVGVIIVLMSVINNIMAGSIGRYFAVAVGKCQSDPEAGIVECQQWFNVAVLLHTILPSLLIVIGAPIGYWAVENYFVIPAQYISTSYWVFSYALIISYVTMVTVPYRALYTARQEIAEMTLYTVGSTIVSFCFAYSLLHYSGDKLFYHATYGLFVAIVPNILLSYGAIKNFPECKFKRSWMFDKKKIKEIFAYTGWIMTGSIAMTIQQQGLVAMVNRHVGLQYNTTNNIAGTLSNQASTLSSALASAFSPAIQNAAGAGQQERYVSLVIKSCKFGTVLCLLFVLPMMLELDYVVNLWLVNPPDLVVELCRMFLLVLVVERIAGGMLPAIHAYGKIAVHEVLCGVAWSVSLVVAWYMICSLKFGVMSVGWVALFITFCLSLIRLMLWRFQLGYPLSGWVKECLCPIIMLGLIALAIGYVVRSSFVQSFVRVVAVSASTTIAVLVLAWSFVLTAEEKKKVSSLLKSRLGLGV